MKDVSAILAKRLKMLEKPFSRDWVEKPSPLDEGAVLQIAIPYFNLLNQ